jgi:hypothetical protein
MDQNIKPDPIHADVAAEPTHVDILERKVLDRARAGKKLRSLEENAPRRRMLRLILWSGAAWLAVPAMIIRLVSAQLHVELQGGILILVGYDRALASAAVFALLGAYWIPQVVILYTKLGTKKRLAAAQQQFDNADHDLKRFLDTAA